MPKPLVAIVGRPNVGKSTFFNRLIGERRAVVDDKAGTTRDGLVAEAEKNVDLPTLGRPTIATRGFGILAF